MMLEGYIARDQSGTFCFFFSKPTFYRGLWVVDDEAYAPMLPEDVPEEIKDMTYKDVPVKYRLYTSVRDSEPYEED